MDFLADPTVRISAGIKRTIRTIQTFVPEAAYLSRRVALEIHSNKLNILQCCYHEKTKNDRYWDGLATLPYLVYGIPYAPIKAGSVPPHGAMHCGCPIDDVLQDFYFWKTWTAQSRRPDYHSCEEGMAATVLNPCCRTFVIQAYHKMTGLTLDDIYSVNHNSTEHHHHLVLTQTARLISKLNGTQKGNDTKYKLSLEPRIKKCRESI